MYFPIYEPWLLTVSCCVFCFVFSGVLETDYPAGEEVPQDPEASQGDGVSLAGSVASVGSTGSDGAMSAEGTTAIPQTASLGFTDQPAEHSGVSGSGSSQLKNALIDYVVIAILQTSNTMKAISNNLLK